ncbi:MAG: hypothetical protein QOH26_2115, partial [Actinomycetota bacterium]|nr:hypothetical protein [Actinomycetota bacterium]
GPRHIDEIHFFRKHLGLPRTIGLDLFGSSDGSIISGDMHDMPFDRGRFKMIFCAGTLSYGYYSRKVIEEMARVAERPGYVFLMDAANRRAGPDALGRSDDINVDVLTGLFYRHPYNVLSRDRGRSLDPQRYAEEPCLALELT